MPLKCWSVQKGVIMKVKRIIEETQSKERSQVLKERKPIICSTFLLPTEVEKIGTSYPGFQPPNLELCILRIYRVGWIGAHGIRLLLVISDRTFKLFLRGGILILNRRLTTRKISEHPDLPEFTWSWLAYQASDSFNDGILYWTIIRSKILHQLINGGRQRGAGCRSWCCRDTNAVFFVVDSA